MVGIAIAGSLRPPQQQLRCTRDCRSHAMLWPNKREEDIIREKNELIRSSALLPFTICSTRHCLPEGMLMAPTLPTRMLNWSLGLNETHARYASDVNRVTSWRGSDRDRVFFLFFFFPPLSTDVRLVDTPTCGNPFWTACWRPRARSIVDCTVHCRLKKTFRFS